MLLPSTTKIIAIAIPLGLCFIASISIAVFVYFFLYLRMKSDHSEKDLEIRELNEQLNHYWQRENPHYDDRGVLGDHVELAFKNAYVYEPSHLSKYIDKCFSKYKTHPAPEEISRLEAILFAKPPPPHPKFVDRDFSIFPNPRKFTAADIVSRLHDNRRRDMIKHIMVSILLKNTSLEGNPCQSLLPLGPDEINSWYNLSNARRNGLDLDGQFLSHICRFGLYASHRKSPEDEEREREPYYKLFEDLFHPYFGSNSPEDVKERRSDLNAVFDDAVIYGMKCLGYVGLLGYDWCEDKDEPFEHFPVLWQESLMPSKLGKKVILVKPV